MKRIAAALVAVALFVAGCGGSHKPTRPPLSNLVVANCSQFPAKQHVLGACLPHPRIPNNRPKFLSGTAIQGPDLSNNDPVYGVGNWSAIAARNRFAYLKSTEGVGFYDSTAASMASAAKANHLPVGGYDFVHLCNDSASSEANFFVNALQSQGLLGAGTLPPAADIEYGSSGCDTSAWVNTWLSIVKARTGRTPIIYTGAWFWNPNLGSFWPSGILSWISGYGVSYPYMPSGLSHLDIWQWGDNAFNGANNGDMSSWMHDAASFATFVGNTPPVDPYAIFLKTKFDLGHHITADEYDIVKGWDQHKCLNPTRRPVCGYLRYRLVLLRGRLWTVAHYSKPANFADFHRHQRFQDIQDRIHMEAGPWGKV